MQKVNLVTWGLVSQDRVQLQLSGFSHHTFWTAWVQYTIYIRSKLPTIDPRITVLYNVDYQLFIPIFGNLPNYIKMRKSLHITPLSQYFSQKRFGISKLVFFVVFSSFLCKCGPHDIWNAESESPGALVTLVRQRSWVIHEAGCPLGEASKAPRP